MRVLVFPSCNEPGLEVIDALRLHHRIEVLGGSSFDIEADPSRPVLGDQHYLLPALDEPDFAAKMRAFCAEHRVDILFPTMDSVAAAVAGWQEPMVIAPSPEIATLVLSKSRTYDALRGHVDLPRAFDPGSMSFPAFAKPDVGSGSRGATEIADETARAAAIEAGLLVQELLPGDEFTVDCVGDRDGNLLAASVRVRTALAGGIARSTRCIRHTELEAAAARIAAVLPIAGPWFAQFREDRDGVPRLMEVNARVGGSSGATRLAGVNIPLLAVLSFTGVPVRAPRRADVLNVVRKLDRRGDINDFDLVIWDLDDTLVHAGDVPDPDAIAWLYRLRNAKKRQALVTKNPNPSSTLANALVPAVFESVHRTDDKIPTVLQILADTGVPPERTIMINDSGAEKLQFEEAIPAIRTFTPDALGALAG